MSPLKAATFEAEDAQSQEDWLDVARHVQTLLDKERDGALIESREICHTHCVAPKYEQDRFVNATLQSAAEAIETLRTKGQQ